ncbi:GNAT family N-acetyltransferase [Serinibacter arcticus]|uniref:GNAT family N-acetyltransferase n=1 Tax=Serinibacter arcticus TaxID=1655435 RepID=A0A2U1ZWI5_9MICO|nr:GNAT family N-acetyltransferase [Serinibacter arcticus]PWD51282.1 GNAT family N-acetyltransferase [Serinibacter arcticus]
MASTPAPTDELVLRELAGIAEISAAAALISAVFGATDGEPVPADLMMGIALSGGYVGGAFLGGRLVGVAVGFGEIAAPGAPSASPSMHSHVAAVSTAARGRRVGRSLKLHQRDWALDRGIGAIEWTFDPLVRRNAFVNLSLLGATGVRYLPNLYGEIPDALNAGQESDRVLVRWDLTSPRAAAAAVGDLSEPVVTDDEIATASLPPGIDRDTPAAPHPHRERDTDDTPAPGPPPRTPQRHLCGTPADIEHLLRSDPDAARGWRAAQRAVLQPAIDGGAHLTGITRTGWYVLEESA